MRKLVILSAIFMVTSCFAQVKLLKKQYLLMIVTTNIFPTNSHLSNYRLAANYSKIHGGRVLIVIRGYNIVFEEYHNGHVLLEISEEQIIPDKPDKYKYTLDRGVVTEPGITFSLLKL